MKKAEVEHLDFLKKIKGKYPNNFTDEDLLNQIRLAREILKERFSSRTYIHLAIKDERFVTLKTICTRFGTWNNALERAGIPLIRQRRNHTPLYSQEYCIRVLTNVTEALGHFPTVYEYERLQQKTGPPTMPSLSTMRERLGGWSNAAELVMEAKNAKHSV